MSNPLADAVITFLLVCSAEGVAENDLGLGLLIFILHREPTFLDNLYINKKFHPWPALRHLINNYGLYVTNRISHRKNSWREVTNYRSEEYKF